MDRIIRGANWYCQETNQRQRIDETTLPELRRDMLPFVMGGGYFAFELPAEIAPLTCEMAVNGVHEDLKSRFGREPGDWTNLRYYESLLNQFTQGGVKGMKSSAATRLGWSSIVLYHDMFNGKTVHKFDLQNNILIINGVNYTAEHNRLVAA